MPECSVAGICPGILANYAKTDIIFLSIKWGFEGNFKVLCDVKNFTAINEFGKIANV